MDNKPGFQGPQRGNRPPFKGQQRDKDPYIINERIRAREVRLVGDNVENGIYSIHEALKLAEEQELDLIEISSTAQPPVCKILDYQKFLYQQKKRQKEQKAKAAKSCRKGNTLRPTDRRPRLQLQAKTCPGVLKRRSQGKSLCFLPWPKHPVQGTRRSTFATFCKRP